MSNCKINVPYDSSDEYCYAECRYAERRYARRRGAAESGCYRRTHKRSLKMLFLQSQKKLDDGKKSGESRDFEWKSGVVGHAAVDVDVDKNKFSVGGKHHFNSLGVSSRGPLKESERHARESCNSHPPT
jgi:hypothetical protein